MHCINEKDVELVELPGRSYKFLASEELLGCKNFSGGVAFYPPKKHAPGHIHDKEEEVIYFLEGSGEIVVGSDVRKVEPGTTVFVPPKVMHSVNNTGDVQIKIFFVYSPATRPGVSKDYNIK